MSTTVVSKRKLRKELEQKLNDQIVSRSVYQERPYTCIVLEVKTPYGVVQGIGFSKVCYPDRWNAQRGEELAKDKTITRIAKTIMEKMEADKPRVVRSGEITNG
jgi:hypothetical protein